MKPFGWLNAMLQKGFSNSFWCSPDRYEVFLSLKVLLLKERKMLHSSVTIGVFFFQTAIIFATNFLWTCPQKNICIANWLLLLNKRLKNESWKKTKIFGGKKESYFRRLFGPLHATENRKFRRYCILALFGQWNQSKEFSKQLSFSGSKVHPPKRNIKDRQRICFLFVDWANWKFFFFVEEMFRVSIVFSCL